MEQISYYVNTVSFGLVILLWFVFAGTFLLRKKPATVTDATSAPKSWFGLGLQGFGFALVWALRRAPMFSTVIDGYFVLNIVLQIIAVGVAASSVWLAISAVKELGKQWSVQARLIDGHKLVKTGVYANVRHPIYTAMLGMLVASGVVFSHWLVLLIAITVFVIGTRIRTVSEERLLKDAFGQEFDDFRAKVPALIPFVKF